MRYREFGRTGLKLSEVGLGGLLARFEGIQGHPPPEEKRRIYLQAAALGVNLFDMGYGDEVHIPDELKGPREGRHFSLKVGAPKADDLDGILAKHLKNIRRDCIDILRVQHNAFADDARLREKVIQARQAGKIRAICTIRHYPEDQAAYAERGPHPDADADLVIYNYVCRWQEAGISKSARAGKAVLIMKSLGGQWLGWEEKATTDWTQATRETYLKLSPHGENLRPHLDLVYPLSTGPWKELARPGERVPPTHRAVQWVLRNPGVHCVLVAVASVAELREALGSDE
ncbi:MAG: aldo/keto reductase [Planctomycetes bacterium]|nr:aldo/keto reductase [Planctomycetota bacterium]